MARNMFAPDFSRLQQGLEFMATMQERQREAAREEERHRQRMMLERAKFEADETFRQESWAHQREMDAIRQAEKSRLEEQRIEGARAAAEMRARGQGAAPVRDGQTYEGPRMASGQFFTSDRPGSDLAQAAYLGGFSPSDVRGISGDALAEQLMLNRIAETQRVARDRQQHLYRLAEIGASKRPIGGTGARQAEQMLGFIKDYETSSATRQRSAEDLLRETQPRTVMARDADGNPVQQTIPATYPEGSEEYKRRHAEAKTLNEAAARDRAEADKLRRQLEAQRATLTGPQPGGGASPAATNAAIDEIVKRTGGDWNALSRMLRAAKGDDEFKQIEASFLRQFGEGASAPVKPVAPVAPSAPQAPKAKSDPVAAELSRRKERNARAAQSGLPLPYPELEDPTYVFTGQ